jgi:hypothetical protein
MSYYLESEVTIRKSQSQIYFSRIIKRIKQYNIIILYPPAAAIFRRDKCKRFKRVEIIEKLKGLRS